MKLLVLPVHLTLFPVDDALETLDFDSKNFFGVFNFEFGEFYILELLVKIL